MRGEIKRGRNKRKKTEGREWNWEGWERGRRKDDKERDENDFEESTLTTRGNERPRFTRRFPPKSHQ